MESSRIAQLESLKYDNQFIRIISSKITSLLNQFDCFNIQYLSPFFKTITNFLYYRFSFSLLHNSPGRVLSGIEICQKNFSNLTNFQRMWFIISSTLFNFVEKNLLTWEFIAKIKNVVLKRVINVMMKIIKLISFGHTLIFFQKGRFPTIAERILSIYNKKSERPADNLPTASVDFISKMVIWKDLINSLTVVLNLLELGKVINFISNSFSPLLSSLTPLNSKNEFSLSRGCQICGRENICMPAIDASKKCKHTFCYYCLARSLQAHTDYPCKM